MQMVVRHSLHSMKLSCCSIVSQHCSSLSDVTLQVVMEYNFHWAGKQQMEMLMQPLPPTWGKFGQSLANWASSMLRCKVPLLPCPALPRAPSVST